MCWSIERIKYERAWMMTVINWWHWIWIILSLILNRNCYVYVNWEWIVVYICLLSEHISDCRLHCCCYSISVDNLFVWFSSESRIKLSYNIVNQFRCWWSAHSILFWITYQTVASSSTTLIDILTLNSHAESLC